VVGQNWPGIAQELESDSDALEGGFGMRNRPYRAPKNKVEPAEKPIYRKLKPTDFGLGAMAANNLGDAGPTKPKAARPKTRWYFLHGDYLISPAQLLPLENLLPVMN
jgi:hypothetical protein